MVRIIFFSLLSLFFFSCAIRAQPYRQTSLPVPERVQDLLKRMTREEKIGQLSTLYGWEMYRKERNNVTPSDKFKALIDKGELGMLWGTLRADPWTRLTLRTGLTTVQAVEATNALQRYAIQHSRLGIPLLLAEEAAHGEMAIGTTVFPTAMGQASTWDTALIRQMGNAIAMETRSQGSHIAYGPILDLAREPRWSRVEETYGEDPHLVAAMGVAMVDGLQGNDLKTDGSVIATLKHFAAYGMSDGGQNGGSVTLGKRDLMENILYPFRAAVKAGALSVMSSYNSIDGIPCTADSFLLTDILRKEWGFHGFTVSDLGSIDGLYSTHNIVGSPEAGAALALKAGMDDDLGGHGFGNALKKALEEHLVQDAALDTAVARLLTLKFELGLFEHPYRTPEKAIRQVRSPEHLALAEKLARKSVILLKNDSLRRLPLLPLSKEIKNLAVIGPNADNRYNQIGDYSAPQDSNAVITVLKGIQKELPAAIIHYVKGCNIRDTMHLQFAEAVLAAKQSDAVVMVLGGSSARDFKTEYLATGAAKVSTERDATVSDMESGEGYDRTTLDMMGKQLELLQAVAATGKPVVLVVIAGRPLNLNWAAAHVPAILECWYPGQEGGKAIAAVLFGEENPGGKLPVSIPRSVGQLPVYYNYKRPVKHDYVEAQASPLYPFGYGLSYTKFNYTGLHTEVSSYSPLKMEVSFVLKNVGSVAGDEVPQLYIHQRTGSAVRSVRQLRAFTRVSLESREEKKITFTLGEEELRSWGRTEKWSVEKGEYDILVGSSSSDIRLRGTVQL